MKSNRNGGISIVGKVFLILGGLFCIVVVPYFLRGGPVWSRESACLNACMNNLRNLESARQAWAIKNGTEDPGARPAATELTAFLPAPRMPVCPNQMDVPYKLTPLGEELSCSWHGSAANPKSKEEILRLRNEEIDRWAEKARAQKESQKGL